MNFSATFRYEKQDFMDGYRLANGRGWMTFWQVIKILFLLSSIFLVLVLLIFLTLKLFAFTAVGVSWSFTELFNYLGGLKDSYLILTCLLLPIFLPFLAPWILKMRLSEQIKKDPSFLGERTFSFDQNGLRMVTSKAELNFQWDYFKKSSEGPNLFVLIQSNRNYLIIPKRVFSNTTDEAELRRILESKLGLTKQTSK